MFTRRTLLKSTSSGFGYLAFAALAHEQAARAASEPTANPLAPKKPHFPAKAKRVIFLCMDGGPSHVDTFDYKPKLTADDGKPPRADAAGSASASSSARRSSSRSTARAGSGSRELFPELVEARRRALPPQRHAHRPAEPPAGVHPDALRHLPVPAAEPRGVGALRPGHREREPAGLHHARAAAEQRRARRTTARRSCPPIYQGTKIGRGGFRRPGGSSRWPTSRTRSRRRTPSACNSTSSSSSTRTRWTPAARTPRSRG